MQRIQHGRLARVQFFIAIALFLSASLVQAQTFVTVRQQNQYGDPGTLVTLTSPDSLIQHRLVGQRLIVNVQAPGVNGSYSLTFGAPDGAPLAVGRYDNTSSNPWPGQPLLDYINTSGCSNSPPGYFIVHELPDANGSGLAIDYFFRCGSFVDIRRPVHTMGSIRINSALPPAIFEPFADAGPDIFAEEGNTIGLGAERSYPGSSAITSVRYRQVAGIPVTMQAGDGASFVAPAVPVEGATLTFELEVTNADGLTDIDTIDVHLDSLVGERTFIQLGGDQSHYMSVGDTRFTRYNPGGSIADIVVESFPGMGQVNVRYEPMGGRGRWSFGFAAPEGGTLIPDNYENARQSGSPTQPTFQISGLGKGCNVASGRFVVHEFDFNAQTGKVERLALDFEQHCEDTPPALLGFIRYHSTVPAMRTAAAAGADRMVEQGEHVELNGEDSLPGDSAITTWHWQQISGTSVTLSGINQPVASFLAPSVAQQGDTLVFELTVTNSSGQSDTDRINVEVRGSEQIHDLTLIGGDATDPITDGGTFQYDQLQGRLELFSPPYSRAAAQFRLHTAENWTLQFAAPRGRELEVGRYENVTSANDPSSERAGLSIGGRARSCSTAAGTITIYEISFATATNEITRFAADFEQRCESFTESLRGSIRYHSSLPVPFNSMAAFAGADRRVEERQPVILDGRAVGNPSQYQWRQTVGTAVALRNATGAQASFDAPQVSGGGETLEFELQVRDAGNVTATDRVRIEVVDRSRLQTVVLLDSDPGEWVGNGERLTLLPEDFDFSSQSGTTGNVLSLSFNGAQPWRLAFGTGTSAPFAVQEYDNAQRTFGINLPVVDVAGRGHGCNTIMGRFDVREVSFAAGLVDRLVLRFSQFCDGSSAELRGLVVYRNSFPDAHAGADQTANGGGNVALSASQSTTAAGTIAGYAWRQMAGTPVSISSASSAAASFTAPQIAVGTSTNLEFELKVTDSRGLESTDRVLITVQGVAGTPPSPPSSGGGGGGGSLDRLALLCLLLLTLSRAFVAAERRMA